MPPRSQTLPDGIIRLNKLLSQLNASPKLVLPGVKKLRVTFSSQTPVHIGARHFVKEELPRIRWVNPKLDIEVQHVRKTAKEKWAPQMEVELENGTIKKVDMANKFSTSITEELMMLTGGEEWKKYVFACKNSGTPVVPGADQHQLMSEELTERLEKQKKPRDTNLPTLDEFLKANPKKAEELKAKKPITKVPSSTPPNGQKPKNAA